MLRTLLLGTVLATLTSVSANAVIVDLFNNPYGLNPGPGNQPVTVLTINQASPDDKSYTYDPFGATPDANYFGGIIGNRRIHELVTVTPSASTIFSSTSVISDQGPFPGRLAHNQDTGLVTQTILTYNNLGADGVALDGNGFLLEVAFADHEAVWSLEVTDRNNNNARVRFGTGTPGDDDLIDGFVFVPFSAFISGTGCAAELNCNGTTDADLAFSNITRIQFVANAGERRAFNTEVGSITTTTIPSTVAEPASMTLLGAGLAGIAWLARRRRKSA
jgi:hypothetical protein